MAYGQPNSTRRYVVVSCRDGWEIVADGDPLAWFSNQKHAVQQAIDWAREYGKDGGTSEVLIEAGVDDCKVVWTS